MTKPGVGREGWPEARWPKPRGGQEPPCSKRANSQEVPWPLVMRTFIVGSIEVKELYLVDG